MNGIDRQVARLMLDAGCISVGPDREYTFTPYLKSTLYCDTQRILSVPAARREVVTDMVNLVRATGSFDAVFGIANSGLALAALIAEELELPLGYVRLRRKMHGRGKFVEGNVDVQDTKEVVLIDDVIGTGITMLAAARLIHDDGYKCSHAFVPLDFSISGTRNELESVGVQLHRLATIQSVLDVLAESELIDQEKRKAILRAWRELSFERSVTR